MEKRFDKGVEIATQTYILSLMDIIKLLPLLIFLLFAFEKAYAADFQNFNIIDSTALSDGLSNDLAKDHPLYKKILEEFEHQYDSIGQRQAQSALQGKDIFVGGGLNKIGIRYAKDFIDFKVNVERQLSPDLFSDDRWIVRDMFTLEISASKLLSKLSDEGTIDIGETQYALFAGLSFKRRYSWIHFANSYNEGLTRNFQKLFLPFVAFANKSYLNLPEQEILRKEDFLTFSAGAIGSMPITGPLWASAGALASYKRMAMVQFQSVAEIERVRENEVLRMQVEKTVGAEVGIRASLQIDFLKLLRFTLLSYDFSYSYEHSYKMHLSFTKNHLKEIDENVELKSEIQKGIRYGHVDIELFPTMLLALEDSRKATLKSKYLILLIGGMKDQATTHIQITQDGILSTFFRHNYEKSSYVQNFWSRILGTVFKSLLGLDSLVNKALVDIKRIELEYKSEKNLIDSKDKHHIRDDNFSILMERTFRSGKLTKLTKKHAVNVLETYAGVDPIVWDLLRKNQLRGPISMSGKYIIKRPGLDHFNSMTYKEVYSAIRSVCSGFFCRLKLEKSFDKYWKELSHKSYSNKLYKSCRPRFKFFRSAKKRRYLWESCLQKKTKLTLEQKMKSIPLWRLKGFVQKLSEKTKTKIDLYTFFGLSNVFLHGSFSALDPNGRDFVSYFREGKFDGLGLVDGHLIENGLKSSP